MQNQEPNIDLFGYAVTAIKNINKTAMRKLDNPTPFLREELCNGLRRAFRHW